MTTAIAMPETLDTELTEIESLIVLYQGRELESDENYETAGEHLKTCKSLTKQIRDFMSPIVKAAHEAHKAAKARENETLAPIKKAQTVIGGVMGAYQTELAEARRIAEAEERARLEQEAAKAKEQYVDVLIENDRCDEAEAVEAAPPMRQEPKIFDAAPKVTGTAVRTTWCFEIVNPNALPRDYLIPDEKGIGAVVRARQDNTDIPGVRVWPETKVT